MIFDEVVDRTASDSSRWGGRSDILALTIGDSDFRLPPPVDAAIRSRLDGIQGYDIVPDRLRSALADRLERLYEWRVEPDCFFFMPGVVQGLNLCCRALTAKDESIVTEVPIYYPFLDAPLNAGRQQVRLPARLTDNGWQFDHEHFATLASDPGCRLLLLCHPHNPLGRLLSPEDLEQIASVCLENDLLICSDEIHADILFDGVAHLPMAKAHPEIQSRTVTLSSPSKAFAMSGLGGAFAVIPDPLIRERFSDWAAGLVPNISVLSLAAMNAAYTECDEWLREEVAYLQDSRDYLISRFNGMKKVKVHAPTATYFLWIDFRDTGWNDPYRKLLDHGVELSDGARFGGPGYLRLNFGSARSILEEAADRIERALRD